MARATLLLVVLLLAGCAGHAPLPEPAALEPLAAAPAVLAPASGEGEAIVAGFYALGFACLAVGAVVDVLLLPAYLATEERDLYFPCCKTMLDLAD